jgi:Protein of unknwon function (DUF3310)
MSKLTKKDKIIGWLNKGLSEKEIVKKGYTAGQVYPLAKKFRASLQVTGSEMAVVKKLGIKADAYVAQKHKLAMNKKDVQSEQVNPWEKFDYVAQKHKLAMNKKDVQLEQVNPWEKFDTELAAAKQEDLVNHPLHYRVGGIDTIDFIEAKELGYHLGNVVKYISRAGRKNNNYLQDLKKAQWYLNRAISKAKDE